MTLAVAVSGLLTAAPARAARDSDPQVARVSFVEGDVSYLNADVVDEWAPVDVNAPLFAGDRFYSGDNGRAEIQLGPGVYVRLAANTEVDLMDLTQDAVQVRVGIGTATFRLRNPPRGQGVEISTPGAAVVAQAKGVYRIDVAEDGRTTVLVRDGEVEAYRGDDRFRIGNDRGAEFMNIDYQAQGDGYEPVQVFDASTVATDDWDRWEASRAARVDRATSYKYVSSDVYGVEDLDEYGTWQSYSEYGPVWRPTQIAAGWTPYSQGRWVWQDPWGWTWVDYAPWGWAPSHYGRWVYVNNYWGWAPGPIVAQPAYAPAVVGFVGFSTPSVSVSVGIGGPSVGWVPLGYGEPILPWWGGVGGVSIGQPWWGGWGGPRIVNNTVINKNITNINVNNINYANWDHPDAITAVTRDGFVNGNLQRLNLNRDQLRGSMRALNRGPDVVPQRESLFAARPEKVRGGRAARPTADVLQRAAVSRRDPGNALARASFDQKARLIEQRKGEPLPPQELKRIAQADRDRSPIRTVKARGTRAVEPAVTAAAPARAGAPVERRAAVGERGNAAQTNARQPNERQAAQQANERPGNEPQGNERQTLGRERTDRTQSPAGLNAGQAGDVAREEIRKQREAGRAPENELREQALRARQERAKQEKEGGARANVQGQGRERQGVSGAQERATEENARGQAAGQRPQIEPQQQDNARRSTDERERQRAAARPPQPNAERAPSTNRALRDQPERAQQQENARKSADQRERQGTAARPPQADTGREQRERESASRARQQAEQQRESAQRSNEQRARQSTATKAAQPDSSREQRERASAARERQQAEQKQRESARQSNQERERQRAATRAPQPNVERQQREQVQRQSREQQEKQAAARKSASERQRSQSIREPQRSAERPERQQAAQPQQRQESSAKASRDGGGEPSKDSQKKKRKQAAEEQPQQPSGN